MIKKLTRVGHLQILILGTTLATCESSIEGKMIKRPFAEEEKGRRANKVLDIVHTDVSGPLIINSRGGYEYFSTFSDDYSQCGFVYPLCHISETF